MVCTIAAMFTIGMLIQKGGITVEPLLFKKSFIEFVIVLSSFSWTIYDMKINCLLIVHFVFFF